MVLRKITVDNSFRFIPKSEQSNEKEKKPKTIKTGSLPRKQNKNVSRNNKKTPQKYFSTRIQIL